MRLMEFALAGDKGDRKHREILGRKHILFSL